MSKNILSTPKKRTINLGGKDYKLSPLNLNVLAAIEDEFGCGVGGVGQMLEEKQASSMRKLLYVLLKDQYPDMTLTKIGGLITISNIAEVSDALAGAITGD